MAAEVPLPSAKPPATYLRCPVRTRPGRPASVSQLRAVQSRGPSFGVRVRSRAHQPPFYARGLQKIGAVSENAPGAHGIVPRHCSPALFHARGGDERRATAKPLPRSSPYGTVPAAKSPPRSPRRNRLHREPSPRDLRRETSATKPPPRSPCRAAAPMAPSLPQRESGKFSRSRPRRETPAAQPPQSSLYLDAKSSRARPASSTARSTALSLM